MVSISFQFVGFLLTYLLHTTHAARYGSRAGLGVTLIQYGFALRTNKLEDDSSAAGWWGVGGGGPYGSGMQDNSKPSFGTKEEAEDYYRKLNMTTGDGIIPSGTIPGATMDDVNFANEATTDWLSFFLMTVGWFILITSLLGFWRVKRWERNILASQRETTVSAHDAAGSSQSNPFSVQLHRMVGLPMRDVGSLIRSGLGFSRRSHEDLHDSEQHEDFAEGGGAVPLTPITPSTAEETSRRELIIAMWAHDPERQRQIIQAFRDDDQLMADMQAAGML